MDGGRSAWCYAHVARLYGLTEVAELLGVSPDTVRRLIIRGDLPGTLNERGHRMVAGSDLAAYMVAQAAGEDDSPSSSARNRIVGIITAIKKNSVMAQVEIQAGPFRLVSLLSREALDSLGLRVGDRAAAVIKATTVIVETGS
jgi:molybdopterin-binding protein